jgi:hypothetical protein
MTQITVNAEVAAKLLQAGPRVEIYDESGLRLGAFTRSEPTREELLESCPLSDEELDARRKQPGGRPLKEILDDLEKLP